MLTNRSRSFHSTSVIETSLSDCHKLIVSFFSAYFQRIPPKTIEYINFKNFDKAFFLYDFDQELIIGNIYKDSNNQYDVFTVDKHAPLKRKKIRGNQAPFMTKELSKTI